MIACQSASDSNTSTNTTDPVAARLSGLPFDAMMGLGPHTMTATMDISDDAPKRDFESKETYHLKWEGWRRYAYHIVKSERPTLNVIVINNDAYQIKPDGKARLRANVHDFHYYLQQTWNLWAVATRPFGNALAYKATSTASRDGRPSTRYAVSLNNQGLVLDDGTGAGTMRTQLITATGSLWMDDTTGLPVEGNFEGQYKTVRVSRVPGRQDAETRHRIQLTLLISNVGQTQDIEPPVDLIGVPAHPSNPAPAVRPR